MNRHEEPFELEPELRPLDEQLRRALLVTPPEGLSRRIADATARTAEIDADLRPLDGQLRRALPIAPPEGLAGRIHDATADRWAGRRGARPAVVGRIGFGAAARRVAIAAAVLLAAGLSVWVVYHRSARPPQVAENTPPQVVAAINVDELVARIHASLARPGADPVDPELLALSVELDELAMAFDSGPAERDFGDPAGRLYDELYLLETQMRAF